MPPRRALFPDILVFASGSNHAGEIKGFGAIGQHVGVAAPELNEAAIQALLGLPPHIHVFVDSGAFSEVSFAGGAPKIVKEITDKEWKRRLALYMRLAQGLGPRVHVVAPDQVGSQEVTLRRLATYAQPVREIAATGAEVLVPLQRGALPLAAFERACAAALGWSGFVSAIPMKKQATSVDDLLAYVAARKPHRVHLLGLGERNDQARAIVDALRAASPGTNISLDSNRITAAVGRGGKGARKSVDQRRPLTRAHDAVTLHHASEAWSDDYEENIGSPEGWLNVVGLKKVATAARLSAAEARAFVKDPSGYLSENGVTEAPVLWHVLDDAWVEARHLGGTTERKAEAIGRAFGPELREKNGRTIFYALYQHAAEEMMKPTSTLYNLVEWLDVKSVRREVETAAQRAVARARSVRRSKSR